MFRAFVGHVSRLVVVSSLVLAGAGCWGPLDEEPKSEDVSVVKSAAGSGPTVSSILVRDALTDALLGTDSATIAEGRSVYFTSNVTETLGENDGVQSAIWDLGPLASITSPHVTCDDAGVPSCAPEPGGSEDSFAANTSFLNFADNTTYTVTLTVCDEVGPVSCTLRNFALTVSNVAPVATDDVYSTDEDQALVVSLPGVLGNDTDVPADTLDAILVTDVSFGVLTLNTDTGAFTYNPNLDFTGTDSFTYTARDDDGGISNVATVTLTVNQINDAPVNTVPVAQSVAEEAALLIPAMSVADVDVAETGVVNGTGEVRVTLSVGNGTLVIGTTTGLTFIDPAGDALTTFQGLLADVNTALGTVTYTGNLDFNGPEVLTLLSDDLGNTGAVAPLTDSDTVNITVTQVDDAPIATVPGPQTTDEDTALGFTTISFSDVDVAEIPGTNRLEVSLSVGQGTLTLASTTGLTFTSGANGSAAMVFEGSPADVNAAVNGLSYLPNLHYNGGDLLSVVVDDLGNTGTGGPLNDPKSVAITVQPINDAPVATVPGAQSTNEDTALVVPGVSVADVDVAEGTNTLQVSLSVAQGTLTLSSTVGLTFLTGADGTASMSFTGTPANVNGALIGLSYLPNPNYFGPDTLNLGLDDLGNFGAVGPLTDSKSVAINVLPVNDAPVAENASVRTIEDVAIVSRIPQPNYLPHTGAAVPFVFGDDQVKPVALPFDVTFGGVTYAAGTNIQVSSNGNVQFASGFTTFGNSGLPAFGGAPTIFPLWDDLIGAAAAGGSGDAWSEVQGLSPNRVFILEWELISHFPGCGSNPVTFEAVFFEGSGEFELNYQDISFGDAGCDNGASATVGVQVSGTNFNQYSFNTASLHDGLTLRWRSTPENAYDVLESPFDVETNPLTFVLDAPAGNGLVTLNLDGTFTYTPALDYNGPDSFTYHVNDGFLDSNVATITIGITPVNDEPSFTTGGPVAVDEDSGAYSAPWASSLSAGPIDENAQLLDFVVTNVTLPGLFSVQPAVDPSGVLTFATAANEFGSADVTLHIHDNGGIANGGDDTGIDVTFTITLNPVNDAPSFTAGPNVTVDEDSGAYSAGWATNIIPGPANEGAQLVDFVVTGVTNAGLFSAQPAVSPTGVLTFTPALNQFGSSDVTLHLHDDGGVPGVDVSGDVTFTITVNNLNDPPAVAINSAPATVAEGTPFTMNVTISEPAGDPTAGTYYLLTFLWGDASSSTRCVDVDADTLTVDSPSHAYADDTAAPYLVSVTALDSENSACTAGVGLSSVPATTSIAVTNVAPVTAAGGDQLANEGALVSLSGASFTDAGTGDTHTATIDWNDGSPVAAGVVTEVPGSGTVAGSHAYRDNGVFTVTVTVSDDDGDFTSDSFIVTVANVDPVAEAGAPIPGVEGTAVCLSGAGFTDAGVDDTHAGYLTGVNWGDYVPPPGSVYNPETGHYYLLLSGGALDTWANHEAAAALAGGHLATIDSPEENAFLLANFAGDFWIGFNDLSVEGSFGWVSGAPVGYTNFGPGQPDNAGGNEDFVHIRFGGPPQWNDNSAAATLPAVAEFDPTTAVGIIDATLEVPPNGTGTATACHTYVDDGVYPVTLVIGDDDLGYHTDTTVATISNAAPVASAPIDFSTDEGSDTFIAMTWTDLGVADNVHNCFIDWGDGTLAEGPFDCSGVGGAGGYTFGPHIYAEDTTVPSSPAYTAAVYVYDKDSIAAFPAVDDAAQIDTVDVTVNDVDPVVDYIENGPLGLFGEAQTYYVYAEFHSGAADGPEGGGSDDVASCTFDFLDGTPALTIPDGFDDLAGTYCDATDALLNGFASAQAIHTYADDDLDEPMPTRPFGAAADNTYTATFLVTDEDSSSPAEPTDVFVPNDAPDSPLLATNSPHPEGQFTALTLSWLDDSNIDSYQIVINWGDLQVDTLNNSAGDKDISTSHLYTNPNTYTVNITVTDDDGGSFATSTSITVTDIPLDITSVSTNAPVAENSAATIWVVADSPNPLEYSYDWDGDGLFGAAPDVVGSPDPFSSYVRPDDSEDLVGPPAGAVRVQVRVFDPLTLDVAFGFVDVVWTNEPPVITSATSIPVNEGTNSSVTVIADDPSPTDDAAGFTYSFDWDGDGVYNPGDNVVGTSPQSGTHLFAAPGTYLVNVRVADEDGEFAETQVAVQVNNVNAAPVAVDDSASVNEDDILTLAGAALTANDTDADGNTLSVSAVGGAVNGTVSLAGGVITFTPTPNFNGAASFTYTAFDGVASSAAATVAVTVVSVNDIPVANGQSVTTTEGTPLAITLTGSDVAGEAGPLTFTVTSAPVHGTLNDLPTANDGAITYTPTGNYNGDDSFTFTVTDGNSGVSSAATVSITVTPVDDPPVAGNDTATTDEDQAVTIQVLVNDSDLDGDALTVTGLAGVGNGSAVIDNATTITFTPAANFNGVETFTYTLSDGTAGDEATGTVTVNVTSINDLPVAFGQDVTVGEDGSVLITLVGDDVEDGSALASYDVASGPANGVLVAGANPDEYTYSPNLNFHGADSFTFTVTDSDGAASSAATVAITVTPADDAPVAVNDTVTTDEDQAVTIQVLVNDSDLDGDALTVTGLAGVGNGSAVIDNSTTITFTPAANFNGVETFTYTLSDGTAGDEATGTVTVNVTSINDLPVAFGQDVTVGEDGSLFITLAGDDVEDGSALASYDVASGPANGVLVAGANPDEYTYSPNLNFHGADSFTFTVTDSDGAASSAATVAITVTPADDAPVAVNDTVTTDEDQAVTIQVLVNDSDLDGDALTVTGLAGVGNGSAVIDNSTTITFTPAANFNGVETFTYTLSDGTAGDEATGTVTVNVTSINDLPVANGQSVTTPEGTPLAITLTGSDVAGEAGPLTFTVTSAPVHGALNDLPTANDGAITYTPTGNYNGDDSFTFTVTDGNSGVSSAATVAITVTPVDDAPVAGNDTVTTDEDQAVTIQVLVNDSDLDGDALTVTGLAGVGNGSAVIDNSTTITFTPAANFNGVETFTYTLSDGTAGDEATGTVTVNVTSINDLPVATGPANVTTPEDTAVAVNLVGADAVGVGETAVGALTYTILSQPAHGVLSGAAPSLTYTPAADFTGDDSFTWRVNDLNGGSSGIFTTQVVVTPVAPTVVMNDEAGNEGDVITFTATGDEGNNYLYAFDFEDDGTFDVTVPAANGQTVVTADHVYPDDGVFTVRVRVTDGTGLSIEDTATATIANVAPTLVCDALECIDEAVTEGHFVQASPIETDPGSADTHTWSMVINPVPPGGMPEFSSVTGEFGWVPTWFDGSRFGTDYDVTITVTDNDAVPNTDSVTFTLTAFFRDEDNDGMSDTWEIAQGMDPTVDDSLGDVDGDGVANIDEYNCAFDLPGNNGPCTPNTLVQVSPLTNGLTSAEDETEDLDLIVNETSDPDTAGPLSYVFEVYDGSFTAQGNLLAMFVTSNSTGTPGTPLTLTVDDTTITNGANANDLALTDNSYYWWRARARELSTDPNGVHPGPWSAFERVFYNPDNDAPTAPLLTSPLDTAWVSSLTPVLVTDNASDVDDFLPWGDLTLLFEVFDSTNALVTSTSITPQGAYGNTSWVVNQPLTENTWYTWTVTASDPNDHPDGSQSTVSATWSFFVSSDNDEPSRPTLVAPADNAEVNTLVVDLTVGNATDPEGLPLTYLFEVASSPTFSSADYQASQLLPEGGNGQTSFTTAALTENTTYYWRCRAADQYSTGEFVMGSFFVNATNDPPTAPLAHTPANGTLVDRDDVVLTLENATDPDINDTRTYGFQVYKKWDDENDNGIADAGELTGLFDDSVEDFPTGVTETTTLTSWEPKKLKAGKSYWWVAVATDNNGLAGPLSVPQKFEALSVSGGSGCSVSGGDSGTSGLSMLLLGLSGLAGVVVLRRKRA